MIAEWDGRRIQSVVLSTGAGAFQLRFRLDVIDLLVCFRPIVLAGGISLVMIALSQLLCCLTAVALEVRSDGFIRVST
jgi:hypothetical protein